MEVNRGANSGKRTIYSGLLKSIGKRTKAAKKYGADTSGVIKPKNTTGSKKKVSY